MLEAKIAQIEERLRSATVVELIRPPGRHVRVGSVVHVKDEKTGKSVKYTIVGSAEAEPREQPRSPTSRRSARPCSGTSATTTSRCRSRAGPKRKLKITKIEPARK